MKIKFLSAVTGLIGLMLLIVTIFAVEESAEQRRAVFERIYNGETVLRK